MRTWLLTAAVAASFGAATAALAQGNVIAERRAGLREMGGHMEAIGAIVQNREDQRQIVGRVTQMRSFFSGLSGQFPAASLTPPVAQGTRDGQTRALAAIDGNRADFATQQANMLVALSALQTAAEAGQVTPDLLRSTGATCGACHRDYRAR